MSDPIDMTDPIDPSRGVYAISVAAQIVGMDAQRLRLYETRGLLEPERTSGGTRRYSHDDLQRLRRIGDLLDAGVNLAGIGMVLTLQDRNTQLRDQLHQAEQEDIAMADHHRPDPGTDITGDLPEADVAEQTTPAWPSSDDPQATADPTRRVGEANEADLWEQAQPTTNDQDDEEDYDYDTGSDQDTPGPG